MIKLSLLILRTALSGEGVGEEEGAKAKGEGMEPFIYFIPRIGQSIMIVTLFRY